MIVSDRATEVATMYNLTTAEEWLTTAETADTAKTAEMSGYHPERIRELVCDGRINGRKFGIVWRIDSRSLLSFLKEAEDSGDKRRGPKTR